jgi:hypothetical protein
MSPCHFCDDGWGWSDSRWKQMFGLRASRSPQRPASPSPSPVARLALPRSSRTEKGRMKVCCSIPQRDCGRFSRPSLFHDEGESCWLARVQRTGVTLSTGQRRSITNTEIRISRYVSKKKKRSARIPLSSSMFSGFCLTLAAAAPGVLDGLLRGHCRAGVGFRICSGQLGDSDGDDDLAQFHDVAGHVLEFAHRE